METDGQIIDALYDALAALVETGTDSPQHIAAERALALARGEHPTPPESRVGLDPDAGTRQHGEK